MQDRAQIEDLIQILNLIKLRYPLNRLGGWAASADFMKIIYKELLAKIEIKPDLVILETGSGISTILIAYLLEQYAPHATFISLDHDIDYKSKTKRELALHKLNNVHLLYAPLRKYQIDGQVWYWYDMKPILEVLQGRKIDFLSIDGPPMATQPLARYPVLPLLKDRLAQEYVLVLDDAKREEEKAIVERWRLELGDCEIESVATEKGTIILRQKVLKHKPMVSICIPTYNRKEFLSQALASALAQTYENFEVVVVDDGSIDGTKEMLQGIKDPRVRYFCNDINRGRPYSRNRCIDEAKGEYILWLDDDDILDREILYKYLLLLEQYEDAEVVYGILQDLNTGEIFFNPKDFYSNGITLMNNLLTQGCPLPNPGTMVKKSLYNKFGKYNEEFIRAQDYEFWTRIALHAQCKKYNGISCSYRIHDKNISAGSAKLLDTSYESKIVRKMLVKGVIAQAFDYVKNQEVMFNEIAEHMRSLCDNINALYYYQLSHGNSDKAIIVAIQADNLKYAKKLLKNTQENRETLRKILKQYELIKKRSLQYLKEQKLTSINTYIETLEKILPNSWLYFYLLAHIMKYQNSWKEAEKFAIKSLICNPLSKDSFLFLQELGVHTQEIERIKEWLIKPLNEFETKKEGFIELLT